MNGIVKISQEKYPHNVSILRKLVIILELRSCFVRNVEELTFLINKKQKDKSQLISLKQRLNVWSNLTLLFILKFHYTIIDGL